MLMVNRASAANDSSFQSTPSSSDNKYVLKWFEANAAEHASHGANNLTRLSRSNWETHLFGEINELIFKMTRLPEAHDFYLHEHVARRAADLLATISTSSQIEPPRVINEEGDTVLFTWEEGDLKKYLCIDGEEVEIRVRKPGTPYSASETLSHGEPPNLTRLLSALGADVRSGSVR
jgi:hypothetical protein